MRNSLAVVDWQAVGPHVLAWFTAELPRRSSIIGLYADAHAALGLAGTAEGLRAWVTHRPEWPAIKRTLGIGPLAPMDASASSSLAPGAPSLSEYIRVKALNEDRARCPVCLLPEELRAQIAEAKHLGSNKNKILAALAGLHKIVIVPTDWDRHINRRHDQ